MKAWILNGYTGIDSMQLTEVPPPVPAAGEVLLSVRFAALNPADRYLAEAQYPAKPTFPHILGREGLGTIVALGQSVTQWRIGDKCLILTGGIGADRWGTFAEMVAVSADELVAPPEGWTDHQSAASILGYVTAWQALTQWDDSPAPNVLITGASGGVGSAAVQLASAMGSKVIALTRANDKIDVLRELGASIVCNCTAPTWVKQLKEQLGKERVDLAIDNIGGDLFSQVIEVMGMNGRLSVVGRLAGPVPSFNTATLLFRRLRIGGVAIGTWTPSQMRKQWHQLVTLLNQNHKRPVIDHVFSLADLPRAFARLSQGPVGKILLEVTP